MELKYRRLGRSDIKVSEIGFGAWTIGLNWWGKKIEDDEEENEEDGDGVLEELVY